jgi:hypothetical protein
LHDRKRKRPRQYQTDWYGEYGRTWAVPVQLVRREIMVELPGFDVMSAADSAAGLCCLGRLPVCVPVVDHRDILGLGCLAFLMLVLVPIFVFIATAAFTFAVVGEVGKVLDGNLVAFAVVLVVLVVHGIFEAGG